MAEAVTVFVKPGDPASEATLRYLDQRGVAYTKRDVLTDPSATAILFGRLGRVTVPVVQIGSDFLVGHDPVLSARPSYRSIRRARRVIRCERPRRHVRDSRTEGPARRLRG